jgi:hypothetical protein
LWLSTRNGNDWTGRYGQSFAAGYPETKKLSEVLLQLNETSLSQLLRDQETGRLEHKIANAPPEESHPGGVFRLS